MRIILALLILAAAPLRAQWQENGNLICGETGHQDKPAILADGEGGAFLAWTDYRSGANDGRVYIQRVDAHGNRLWNEGGVLVSNGPATERYPSLVSDGAGGVIVVYEDYRSNYADLYAQRIDGSGTLLWDAGGRVVSAAALHQDEHVSASDGQGGVIVAWLDIRDGYFDLVYVQHLDGDGNAAWASDGVRAVEGTFAQSQPRIISDGVGGAIVAFAVQPSFNFLVYVQRLDGSGARLWGANGFAVSGAGGNQAWPVLLDNGLGGAIVAWADSRGGDQDVYALSISDAGYGLWQTNGVPVYMGAGNQQPRAIVSDGLMGAFIVWQSGDFGAEDVGAQRIDTFGSLLWAAGGVAVCALAGSQNAPSAIADGAGGLIVSWQDSRYWYPDVFAQRLTAGGVALWQEHGAPVCTAPAYQVAVSLASDGEGGAILAWQDERSGSRDIYAQRVERSGYWGYPAPSPAGVVDVPADQGGRVTLRWDASRLDHHTQQVVTHYSVWRSLTAPAGSAAAKAAGGRIVTLSEVGADFAGPAWRVEDAGATQAWWEWIANVPAMFFEHYAHTAPTLRDSIAGDPGWHHFCVAAHAADPFTFWISPPDSGYSVDNLAPATPVRLAGERIASPEGLRIHWAPNSESDLALYRIYRGLAPEFTPGLDNLVAAPLDTTWLDVEWRWNSGYHYKVAALDIHGNQSPCALLAPGQVTDAGGTSPPTAFRLAPNYPNPFNPMTTLRFDLPAATRIKLAIFDARGRLVRTLVEGMTEAGRHEAVWDGRDGAGRSLGSGGYFARLEGGGKVETVRMGLVR